MAVGEMEVPMLLMLQIARFQCAIKLSNQVCQMKHVIDHVRSIWNFCFRRFGQSEDDQNLFTRLVEFSHLGGTLARLKNVLQ